MKEPLNREQRSTIFFGAFCLIFLLVVLQLWLLTATMNAYLGGDDSIILPAAIASLLCFAFNALLLRSLSVIERQEK